MKNSSTIRFENCSVGYGSKAIVQNINTTLPQGKISVILGGSGSGKSTLLRHMVGLLRPIEGKIYIGDVDFFAQSPKEFQRLRKRMSMLFQDGALLGALSVIDNVALPLHEHTKLSKKECHAAALRTLQMVGLEDAAHVYPSQLSGGMRKRASLARAIITEPPLLFCDEPTSGLDPITAAQMDALLLQMHTAFPHMTIVVVSHDLASLHHIADHVLVLHEGKAVFSDSLDALQKTTDSYLQNFLARKVEPYAVKMFEEQDENIRKALENWMNF